MPANLLKSERQQRILQLVQENAQATVAELSRHFGVSEATVRRDLEELSENGHLRRTHGGALRAEQAAPEPPVYQRTTEQAEEKRRIGQAAAERVADGETVFIGSGTTTLEVARALVGKRHITVITNALNVANVLAGDPNITLIIVGGLLRPSELSMIGHLTEQALKELRADKVIIGIHAIHPRQGLMNEYLPETMTDREIIRAGTQVIVVADHTKFNKLSAAFVAPVEAIQTVITDSGAPGDAVDALRQAGLEVIVV